MLPLQLNSTQISALTTTSIQALTTVQASSLSQGQINTLTTTQVTVLSTTQLGALAPQAVLALTTTQTASLTTTQLVSLNTGSAPSTSIMVPQVMRLTQPCTVTAANASLTAPTVASLVLLDVAGPNGTEYSHLAALPLATPSATNLQLWAFNGLVYQLVGVGALGTPTVSATAAVAPVVLTHVDGSTISEGNPLRLTPGWKLYAGIGVANASGVSFIGQAKDY